MLEHYYIIESILTVFKCIKCKLEVPQPKLSCCPILNSFGSTHVSLKAGFWSISMWVYAHLFYRHLRSSAENWSNCTYMDFALCSRTQSCWNTNIMLGFMNLSRNLLHCKLSCYVVRTPLMQKCVEMYFLKIATKKECTHKLLRPWTFATSLAKRVAQFICVHHLCPVTTTQKCSCNVIHI